MHARIISNDKATAVTGFTGAAPQVVTGNTLVVQYIYPGTLSATVYVKVQTNTLALSAKWQWSDNESDPLGWHDAKVANNASNVPILTGTGTAVADTVGIAAPDSVYGHRFTRLVLESSGAVGAGIGLDEGSISYNWQNAGMVPVN